MDRIGFDFELGPLVGLVFLVALLALAFEIWMLVDAVRRPEEDFGPSGRTGWVVGLAVGLFLSVIGVAIAIAYFFSVRLPAERRVRSGYQRPPVPGPLAAGGNRPPGQPRPATSTPLNCRVCGAKLLAGARYCHSCGAPTQGPEGS